MHLNREFSFLNHHVLSGERQDFVSLPAGYLRVSEFKDNTSLNATNFHGQFEFHLAGFQPIRAAFRTSHGRAVFACDSCCACNSSHIIQPELTQLTHFCVIWPVFVCLCSGVSSNLFLCCRLIKYSSSFSSAEECFPPLLLLSSCRQYKLCQSEQWGTRWYLKLHRETEVTNEMEWESQVISYSFDNYDYWTNLLAVLRKQKYMQYMYK